MSRLRRGLTLVELVVTISLAAILGIPLGWLLSEQLEGALRARDAVLATNLARAELERLDSLNDFFTPELAPGATTVVPNYLGFPYTMERAVTCLPGGNCTSTSFSSQGVKRITVSIYKPGATDPLARRLSRLTTYRTKHVLFGS